MDIITNYFKLTGKPIATMTVEEYLMFLKFDEERGSSVKLLPPEQKRSFSTPIQHTTQECNAPKMVASNEESALHSKENGSTKLTEKSTILEMLKSVSG